MYHTSAAQDNRVNPYGDPQPILFPERRWGSLVMGFFSRLLPAAQGSNAITTIVDCFSRRVHFLLSIDTESAVDPANVFQRNFSAARITRFYKI